MTELVKMLLAGAACAAAAYLLGSLCFAIPMGWIFIRKDIRTVGSGNAGLTNVLRCAGGFAAILTLIGDLSKSVGSVFLGRYLFALLAGGDGFYGGYIAGLFVILGHVFPLYFGFRGGKGVLCAFGMLLVLDYQIALMCLVVFLIIFLISRYVSLSSISAAAALPVVTLIYHYLDGDVHLWFRTAASLAIALTVIIMHRSNIGRLFQGKEKKFRFSKKEKPKDAASA